MRSFAFLALAVSAAAHTPLPIAFEPNRGQAAPTAEFLARTPSYTLALQSGATATFSSHGGNRLTATPLYAMPSRPVAEQPLPATTNYLKNGRRILDVPSFSRVRYPNLYPGIDLLYYATPSGLEYDFVLAPQADPRRIRLALSGASRMSLLPSGDLLLEGPSGVLRHHAPVAYQTVRGVRRQVRVRYALSGNVLRFSVGAYDHALPLTIDPTLTWAGYSGTASGTNGTIFDDAQTVAIDASGNIYVAGNTVDPTYGDYDLFITKLDPNGAILKRAVIGGEGDEKGYGLAIDSAGAVYFVGSSTSFQWQITSTYAGAGTDALYGKIDAAFSAFVYIGYFGADGEDYGYACTLDPAGNFYFAGVTSSTKFPITRGAPQTTLAGGVDSFLVRVDSTGAPTFGTYLGGTGDDYIYAIASDSAGNIYATGQTNSTNLPATAGAFQTAAGGGLDAFVAKYTSAGTLAWLSYLGGSGDDEANGIAVDASGSAVVTGGAASTNFPTASPYQSASAGGTRDIFVSRFSPDGSKLAWSTYLGGSGDDLGNAVAVDAAGNVYVGGTTNSTNFPNSSAWQSTNRGGADGTVSELSADGASLLFSSYIGGTSTDYVNALALNCTTGLIVAGSTTSTNFPSTLGTAPALAYSQGAAIGYVAKVAAGTATTAISSGGIVNAAPGSLVSLYGSNLAGAVGIAASVPLPTTLNNVTVTVNGATVPLLYVSPTQINFQLPFEVATGTATAIVNGVCGASAPATFAVPSAAPAILLGTGTDALAQNQDFTFNSASNPAPKGSIVTVYLIGIGPLDKPIATGAATPADLFQASLPSKALIGGFDTSIKFLGMTPGFVGLAQANLEIPNLSPGSYPVVITINGVQSNAATLYVK